MENAQKNPQAMQEALLETLNRLARINEVEGFDPRLLVACYKNESGEENLYLPAEPAMLWFRLKYPHGRLEQVATRVTDSMAKRICRRCSSRRYTNQSIQHKGERQWQMREILSGSSRAQARS